jgi:hypothetical protein
MGADRGLAWRSVRVACVLIALAALGAPGKVRGEEVRKPKPYALIFGTVWDPNGHELYAVKVKIRRADEKKARWELESNHTGEFAQRVPVGPGDYVVWADVKGYKLPDGRRLHAGPEVAVHIDGDERQDIGIHLNW